MLDAHSPPHAPLENTRVYDSEAFDERVRYAKECLLTNETDDRSFDTCFEMFDGDLVFVRLLQEAEQNAHLRSALQRYNIDQVRRTLYPLLKDADPAEIASLAKRLRDEFRGDVRAMWPLLFPGE